MQVWNGNGWLIIWKIPRHQLNNSFCWPSIKYSLSAKVQKGMTNSFTLMILILDQAIRQYMEFRNEIKFLMDSYLILDS